MAAAVTERDARLHLAGRVKDRIHFRWMPLADMKKYKRLRDRVQAEVDARTLHEVAKDVIVNETTLRRFLGEQPMRLGTILQFQQATERWDRAPKKKGAAS